MSSMTGKQHQRSGETFQWNDEEMQWLRDNAELTAAEQAKHLKRPLRSVNEKRRLLGIPNTSQQHRRPRTKYLYQRHTADCSGIDPVVIDRIVSAGTIEKFAQQHPVCDCERAYIFKYVPEGSRILLSPKRVVIERFESINV